LGSEHGDRAPELVDMSMHILIIHQAFASLDEPGGTRHFEFARLLAKRGFHVTVIASPVNYITGFASALGASSGDGAESTDGVNILRAPVYTAHHKSFVHRMVAFFSFMLSSFWIGLRVRGVDLVWGTSPPIFQGVTAWAIARLKGARFLFEVRDLWPEFAIAVGVLRNPILIRASEWLERFLYRHADRIIVNSPGFLEHVRARGARNVDLVPNGADPAMFEPSNKGVEFRSRYGLQDRFVALYAGAHGMSNDLDVVLDAAALLRDRNIQFVLLGDGKEKPRLEQRVAELGLRNVTFAASVGKSGIPNALAAADACIAILKSLEEYKTTYPNKVFDYMAAGRPVVLAIDGVIREVVEKAGCGIFAEPGNAAALAKAVSRLADDPRKSRAMGLAGRKYLEANFSRDRISEDLVMLLEEMVKRRRGR
jgi:glycosyltransferase involved in cell wall biosynthesis